MPKSEVEKQGRIDNFERLREEMVYKGFQEKICTISVLKANLLAIVVSIPVIGLCLIVYLAKWENFVFRITLPEIFLFFIVMIVCIVAHEAMHGLIWGLFCRRKWSSIHFGVMWEILTPYCHCTEALRCGSYLFGGLMPLIVLGIGLFVLALLFGNAMLLGISFFNIVGAGADVTIAFMLLRHKNALIYDHPTECGFIAFW